MNRLQCSIAALEGRKTMASVTKTAKLKAQKPPVKTKIRIRMYRQGLGDCFLLRFTGADGSTFHMLIDCGVVLGTDTAGVSKLRDAVTDLRTVTEKHLDLLVVTHEHWDHVSGFQQARELFEDEKLQVDQVWVAWTEDPSDKLACKLRAERRSAENALRMAQSRLAMAGNTDAAARVGSLLGFL